LLDLTLAVVQYPIDRFPFKYREQERIISLLRIRERPPDGGDAHGFGLPEGRSMAGKPDKFQIFVKPGGPRCNLACRYCYYLAKEDLYPGVRSLRMSDDLLEAYIVQHIEAAAGDEIRFSWHGGEPTLCGLDFYRRIVSLQRRHLPPGRRIVNGLVTNGIRLDEEWCRFLAGEGFRVGLSLDGPRDLHDGYRVDGAGRPTHDRVLRAWTLLQRHRVPCDILCVVHDRNVGRPREVYRFFKGIGGTSLTFLPLVVPRPAVPRGVGGQSVPAAAWGDFLCTIFDEWVRNDIGRLWVQIFDEAARPVRGLEHSLCIFRETCGDIPVLEHSGDLYSCDHFVDPEHRLGNIRQVRLAELLRSPAQEHFGRAKRDSLPRYCRQCEVLDMCRGGCPKDRFLRTPDGEEGLNYLCTGWKQFFTHVRPVFEKLVPLWRAGADPARLMAAARDNKPGGAPGIGRNDLCPCGSGKKYKNCCLRG
jgi:uncharacterized protein